MEPLMAGPFEVEYIPLCGHWMQQDQPQVVNGHLLDFLGLTDPLGAPDHTFLGARASFPTVDVTSIRVSRRGQRDRLPHRGPRPGDG